MAEIQQARRGRPNTVVAAAEEEHQPVTKQGKKVGHLFMAQAVEVVVPLVLPLVALLALLVYGGHIL